MLHLKHCNAPFVNLILSQKYYLCCPGWLTTPLGELDEDPRELWHSPIANKIRKSILDNSFSYCQQCPKLDGLAYSSGFDGDYESGPKWVNFSHDLTCNLKCSPCRRNHIIANNKQIEKLNRIQKRVMDAFPTITGVTVSGGDPFASQVSLNLLESLEKEHPNVKSLILCTNGLLLKKKWNSVPAKLVKGISISIDAACEKTYKTNRGGNWVTLMDNLGFIRNLRKSRRFRFMLRFIVQDNNWHEMPDFVKLGHKYGVTTIIFQRLNQGALPRDEYDKRNVSSPDHPKHKRFIDTIASVANDPIVETFHFTNVLS